MKSCASILLALALVAPACGLNKAGSEQRGVENSNEPLFRAAAEGDHDSVKLLLRAGRSPDAVEEFSGRTPLMLAAEKGHSAVVETLIDGKANVNARIQAKTFRSGLPLPGWESRSERPNPGWTALMFAVKNRHEEISRTLVKAGANVNARADRNPSNSFNDTTPLILAAENGHAEIARLLVEAGADVRASDLGGRTPLMVARNVEILNFLQRSGVDLNTKNAAGSTALWRAVGLVDEEMIRFLIEAGADVNARNQAGEPVLMSAHGKALKLLVEAGADVNAKDSQGRTMVMRMAQDGRYKDAVRDLFKLGATLDSITPWQAFLLLPDAVEANDVKTAKAAIQAGANVNESRAYGGLVLPTAAYHGKTEIVRLLIESGANVNAQSPDDVSALHHAALMGRDGVVRLLSKAGADVNAIDKRGNTPLSFALKFKHEETAKILREAGAKN